MLSIVSLTASVADTWVSVSNGVDWESPADTHVHTCVRFPISMDTDSLLESHRCRIL